MTRSPEAEPVTARVPTALADWSLPVIEALLSANCVEDGRFDWKAMLPPDPGGKERLVRGAAGMATAGGGFFVFGVRDNGSGPSRILGVQTYNEFARDLADLLHRADPPIPHGVLNPPIPFGEGRSIYVVEILAFAAPHAVDGRYPIRTGGGTDRLLTTHELRAHLRSHDVFDAPGLSEIKKAEWVFLRYGDWDRIRTALESISSYVGNGSARQKIRVLEALRSLASKVRAKMPDDVLDAMTSLIDEAVFITDDEPGLRARALTRGAEVTGHIGYDATLYLQRGQAVHDCARILSSCLRRAQENAMVDVEKIVLKEFASCEDAARRAAPQPFLDAAEWFEYKRTYPGRQGKPPITELDDVEARLLGLPHAAPRSS